MGTNGRTVIAFAMCAILGNAIVGADEGWSFRVGAGVAGVPVYEGADEYIVAALPDVAVNWSRGIVSLSASSTDGVGLTLFDGDTGILAAASVNVGASRLREWVGTLSYPESYSDRTETRLSDTPDVNEMVIADATIGCLTPIGIIGAVYGYRPVRVDYPPGRGEDGVHHGSLLSVMYLVALPLTDRLSVEAVALLDWMDDRYADAWYSLERETSELPRFDANRGLRSVRAVLGAEYMVTDHFGLSTQLGGTILLGDAADAPYTTERLQTTLVLSTFYAF